MAALGLWLTRRQWRRLWLLYALLAVVTASVVLFYVFARYRYLLVPIVALLAGAGIVGVVDARRERRWRELAAACGILGAVAVGVNLPLVHDTMARAVMYRNMGTALAREGLPHEALRYYRKSIAANPGYVDARMSLARALVALGRKDEAIGEYLMALAVRPDLREAESAVQALLTETLQRPRAPAPSR
jgi:tetratricopeptide (TPR) repeat protein